jgi:D-cysteine desulfhydrase
VEHLREVATRYERNEGVAPYVIPAGGSCAQGAIGFVNAAFELGDQIAQGLLPEPQAIFVAWGTMGTAAGLLIGLKAAGLRSAIRAVRVVPDAVAYSVKFRVLFDATARLLCECDPSFPHIDLNSCDIAVLDEFLGRGYGATTPAALSAIKEFGASGNITLDSVYTGKTGAAFLAQAAAGSSNGPLLFWHTKNSRILPQSPTVDYLDLPVDFHRYFKKTGRSKK